MLSDTAAITIGYTCAGDTDFNHGAVNSTDVSDFINQWFEDATLGCG